MKLFQQEIPRSFSFKYEEKERFTDILATEKLRLFVE